MLLARSDRYLLRDERMIRTVRLHPAALIRPTAEALGVMLVALLVDTGNPSPFSFALWVITLFFYLKLLVRIVYWAIERIWVTNRRVFLSKGIISREVASIPLSKFTDMTFRRSVIGRILNYGELTVESAGQNQAFNDINYIPRPYDFYTTVTTLVLMGPNAFDDYEDDGT